MENQHPNSAARPASGIPKRYYYLGGLALILFFGLGIWLGQTKVVDSSEKSKRVLYYVDPMNPSHTSPEPGLAPCGMKMEPVFADNRAQPGSSDLPPGTVKISSEKQQLLGVRLTMVEPSPFTYTLRSTGRVAVDDTRAYRLNAYAEGWIVKAYDNSIGSLVRKDEPLARYYNRDVAAALQTFYYAVDAVEQTKKGRQVVGGSQDQLVSQQLAAESLLMNLGMTKKQLRDLTRTRQFTQEIVITPPVTSFVLNRNVSEGQRFDKGEEFYRLADLSKVWILADVYGNEAKYIKPGEVVQVTMPSQEEVYAAKVSAVLPQFDTTALTLKVRLLIDNPDFDLKPGMFVDVNFPIHLPASLNIPIDAVMDTGLTKTVFVDRGNGYFEPRQVKIGWRLGDRVEIVAGLKPGDRIVTSGNFLIDSESRMKLAASGFRREGVQPSAGSDTTLASSAAAVQSANPRGQADLASDPVCGLRVPMAAARQAGRTSDYQGTTYYFDTDGCKQRFDQDPQAYLGEKPEDLLVPPNPYDYTIPQLQGNNLGQIPYRRKNLRSNPSVPGQAPVAPPIPKQPPVSPPNDSEESQAIVHPQSKQLPPERSIPAGSRESSASMTDVAGGPPAAPPPAEAAATGDCAKAPPPLPSSTSPPASATRPVPTPAAPSHGGQKQ